MSAVRIKRIAIDNFKSFKGLNVVEKFKDLTAVIGPNGSGKSNFMDAICFAVGEKSSGLRMNRLADLVHGSVVKQPVSRNASVTITFENVETSEELVFQRWIRGNSSEYMFNDEVVSHGEYMKQLETIGIMTGAGNCFVFQGAVESIAMKHPKDMTKMFEEISGSADLKQQYDRLKVQVQEAEQKLSVILQRKRHLISECAEAHKQGKAAHQYLQNLNDLNQTLTTHCLFQLFHNERQIKNLEGSLRSQRDELAKLEGEITEAEQNLKTTKKYLGKHDRDLAKTEQDIREAEVELRKKKSQLVKAKEEVSHIERKLEGALKTLESARKADEAQAESICKLEEELAEANRVREEYEVEILEESQSQGVQIEEDDVHEYGRLKSEVAKRTAQIMQELESINRVIRSEQDRLDNVDRLIAESQDKFSQKEQEEKELQRRLTTLSQVIRASEETLADKHNQRSELQSGVVSSREHLEKVQAQLETVLEQIGDEKTNKYEEERRKRKASIVEQLQVFYKGVYGRMIDLCQPTNSRYNIAFTKVFGSNMEAIVVDTEQTARRCIKYLKEQRLGRETFLPVDYVQYKPIKIKLRDIIEPKNVYLLYDLLAFEPQEIAPVVLYIVSNVLVCQTPEDACKVAYELETRNNAVALDGTYYQKSGIISGGSVDLARKAKRWSEKHMSQLKEEKEKLTEELRTARTDSHKESEIVLLDLHIEGLEKRLKYFRTDLESTKAREQNNKTELSRLTEEINNYKLSAASIQQAIQTHEPKIQELETKLNGIEDRVFADFCRQIGVLNIRQYEDRELLIREKYKQKRLDLQARIDKISNLLIFERNHATQTNVTRWTDAVDSEQKKLDKHKKHREKMKDEMNMASQEVARLENEHSQKTQEINTMKTQVNRAKKTFNNLNKKAQDMHKQVILLESKVERGKSERHALVMDSKLDGLDLPLLSGNIEDIAESGPSQTSSLDISSSIRQYEKEAGLEFDYNDLPRKLKSLVDEKEIASASDKLLKEIQSKRDLLSQEILNTKADEKLQSLQQELKQETEAYNKIRKDIKTANQEFARVKEQRLALFDACFQHVSNEIKNIYSDLTRCEHAKAILSAVNEEEAYLGGINYHCTAPEKRFQMMTNMSGGEKTLAALSLVFAIHSYKPAPFLILDEVDAALDKVNIAQVIGYLKKRAQTMQIIIISLKKEFHATAKLLIGLDAKSENCVVSKFVSLDFDNYNHLF